MTAMPLRAGTLAEDRTQLDLKCRACRHEWSIEITPPVVIVKLDRQTDRGGAVRQLSAPIQAGDRRRVMAIRRQRMRSGLSGLLRSADGKQAVTVLYSLDAQRGTGRLRPLNPRRVFPSWLHRDSQLRLFGYDGAPLRILVTKVKTPREGRKDDDHFAEFVVQHGQRIRRRALTTPLPASHRSV